MFGARDVFRIAGAVALAFGLLVAGEAGLAAQPVSEPANGKSDRLAFAAPQLIAGGAPRDRFVTIARRQGAATTVLEKVAVAH